MKNKDLDFETKAIHVGQDPDPVTGAVIPPIYTTSTYAQESPGEHKGYDYSRTSNPTRHAFEVCVASLEEGEKGACFFFRCCCNFSVCGVIATWRSYHCNG